MKKRVLICLDMDDTLVDANKAHIIAYNRAFIKNGLSQVSAKRLKALFGMVSSIIVKKLFPKLTKRYAKKICDDNHLFLIEETKKHTRPFKGAIKTLKELKKHYYLALLSNCRHNEIDVTLKKVRLNKKLFDAIIGNDDIKHPKPSPDEVIKAKHLICKKLKIKRITTYMVGDTIYDLRAGKRAGAKTIGVLTGNQDYKTLKKENPDMILKNINELPRALKIAKQH